MESTLAPHAIPVTLRWRENPMESIDLRETLARRASRRLFLKVSGTTAAAISLGTLLAACGGDDDDDSGGTTPAAWTPAATTGTNSQATTAPGTSDVSDGSRIERHVFCGFPDLCRGRANHCGSRRQAGRHAHVGVQRPAVASTRSGPHQRRPRRRRAQREPLLGARPVRRDAGAPARSGRNLGSVR